VLVAFRVIQSGAQQSVITGLPPIDLIAARRRSSVRQR
jgi:hypothetical protein